MSQLIIAPSLLACDFSHLAQEVKAFNQIDKLWFHLDIMDGHFVPNLTFGRAVLKNIHQYTTHLLDAHFMVTDPLFYLSSFKDIGLHNFTFHYEAVNNPLEVIKKIKKEIPSAGISIKPNTPVEALSDEILKAVDLVLIMSVEPGFGGQSYIKGSEDKVMFLKRKKEELNLNFFIQVDGGVNEETSKVLIKAGADILVAGSYIFKSSDYKKSVDKLRL